MLLSKKYISVTVFTPLLVKFEKSLSEINLVVQGRMAFTTFHLREFSGTTGRTDRNLQFRTNSPRLFELHFQSGS